VKDPAELRRQTLVEAPDEIEAIDMLMEISEVIPGLYISW
jgi:hypothetical protein